jgi:hypothetical protein
MNTQIEVTARAKAFSGQGVRKHRFLVRNRDVRVWDPIAEHYTTCNALTASAKQRIARLAELESA